MKSVLAQAIAVTLVAAGFGISGSILPDTAVPTQMVVTVRPTPGGNPPLGLEATDLSVVEHNTPEPVVGLQRLTGDYADMQFFLLLDDSTRSSSLGTQLSELKAFVKALPATARVAVGYMRNGTFTVAQPFTADHPKAAGVLRPPMAIAGGNGSPYFALSSLAKHWPSKEPTHRRAVLMLTDGVDRYYGVAVMDDPWVDEAIHDSLKAGIVVYSIYLRGAGLYGRGEWVINTAQSRLEQVSQETGGKAWFEGLTDPVAVAPFLDDLKGRLANQYEVTIASSNDKGVQPVKLLTETQNLHIQSPTRIFVR